MAYFEELELEHKYTTPGRTITDGMASIFINMGLYTAPYFNDESVADKSVLGWRALPGRVALYIMGGLLETYGPRHAGPGLAYFVGVNNMSVKTPLKVGDTVHLESERIELKETSNPRWGREIAQERLINQKGELVCQADIIHLYERKPK